MNVKRDVHGLNIFHMIEFIWLFSKATGDCQAA
jgi:hypothetical protein